MDNSKSKRWFIRTCTVCVVTCVFVFCCCIYCTLLLDQIREITKTYETKKTIDDAWDARVDKEKVVKKEDDHVFEVGSNVRHKRKAVEETEKAIRKIIDESKSTDTAKGKTSKKETDKNTNDTPKKKDKKKRKKKKKTRTKAAHYESVFTKPFENSTFLQSEEELKKVVRSFKAAKWVLDKNSPFSVKDNGFFTARFTGLYLIYAQVLFHDNKDLEVLRLVQVRNDQLGGTLIQTLTCHDSVDRSGPVRYKSCGIIGLFNINKGDIVYLENVFSDVTLNLRAATTYLGAILLK